MHDIGVTWHHCSEIGCDYKSKNASNLTRHLQGLHYPVYCQRKKGQEEECVRVALLASGWLEWSSRDTLPPHGHFKREHHIDFGYADASPDKSFCRIDFVLSYECGSYVRQTDGCGRGRAAPACPGGIPSLKKYLSPPPKPQSIPFSFFWRSFRW